VVPVFIAQDLAVGEPAVAIDGGVGERVTDFGAMPPATFVGSPVDPPTATWGLELTEVVYIRGLL
jgi:hypothetical protein